MSRTKRILAVLFGLFMTIVALASCTSSHSSTSSDQQRAAQTLNALDKSQPVPVFNYSQIRQTLIDAETLQAQSTQTTTFFFNQGVADPVFICPSIGFPVPGTDQITNPTQMQHYNGNPYTLDQIEPNGIYGGHTTATLVLCVNASGQAYLHHAEEFAHAISGAADWDYTHHIIRLTGAPTFNVKTHK